MKVSKETFTGLPPRSPRRFKAGRYALLLALCCHEITGTPAKPDLAAARFILPQNPRYTRNALPCLLHACNHRPSGTPAKPDAAGQAKRAEKAMR